MTLGRIIRNSKEVFCSKQLIEDRQVVVLIAEMHQRDKLEAWTDNYQAADSIQNHYYAHLAEKQE